MAVRAVFGLGKGGGGGQLAVMPAYCFHWGADNVDCWECLDVKRNHECRNLKPYT